ncbi:NAD(P)/FAD-dependent oxidoreductase [Sphingosinicella terrae]|uniref:NAD(P)/FAD-dependent oxidoreductase n=1 Tax=Sphingosinicella terrae TaxID=2172047 RepID=UPI000E0D8430|nr:NAD(P)/FAD-dependent oxidoreductase [Sphingosinicella terrae]
MDDQALDCLIIGGGPAGLTAAIYLSRFHLRVRVVDEGRSRAGWIPCTRNVPGFPDGIAGEELLDRMRAQAEKYGVAFTRSRVTRLDRAEDGFTAEWGAGTATARAILLATGIRNRRPDMDEELHDEGLARGLIRYCPICDGFEVTDRKVGVIGSGSHGVAEAVFLRSYTADVTLIAPGEAHSLSADDQARLRDHAILALDGPARGVALQENCIVVETAQGHHAFDSVYPALGSDIHSELAEQVDVATNGETGCISVDSHQRTNVPGIYAAGDVVIGLDQISHAMGEGGVAATTIRNDLAKRAPLDR